MRDALLMDFDYEMASTRTYLERVPADKLAWQPHPKSMTLGRLAQHLADMPDWVRITFHSDRMDVANYAPPPPPASPAELLAQFDANVAQARDILANASDAAMMEPWSMCKGDQVFFTMPRLAVHQTFIIKHIVHHRAQLGVFLRLLDVAVPSAYGPTADDALGAG